MMKVVIDLNRRSPGTSAHALNFFESDQAIRRCLTICKIETPAGVFHEFLSANCLTANVRADLDVVAPNRMAMQHGVVADDFIYLQRGDATALGYFVDQFARDIAHFVLSIKQHRHDGGSRSPGWITG